jgi:deazaflavin-dependent oxidoreductase (nitroreductase family)
MTDLDAHRFCYVTTRGRVTGNPHTIEIWFAAADRTLYILLGGGERSDTARNILKEPSCRVRVGEETFEATFEATGRIVDDPEEAQLARTLVPRKYAHEEEGLEEWAATALPVAFTLGPSSTG